jgi:hypothetical protein
MNDVNYLNLQIITTTNFIYGFTDLTNLRIITIALNS